MESAVVAAIDRRIEIIDGSEEQKRAIIRVSHLRGLPYVVLLGEPGSGKTTILEFEARQQGVEAIKVGVLIDGIQVRQAALFLDALDEFRSDGQTAEKTRKLGGAIKATGAESWWLSCRAEDWRKEADIQAVRSTTNGSAIVVAQLLPLNYWEAAEILRALGEDNPEAFLDKAESLGADAFTHNPLSLRLLRAAVEANGDWPKTRFDLFESAVWRLAHESNPDRKHDRQRPTPDAIIETADIANLMLLVSGARALWRSNGLPPHASADRSAYLAAYDLGIDHALIHYALDTALFRGEGEAFEPMHRVIAEFTAARGLARAVRGDSERAAFPLSRALALIAAPDGAPPTELRGLYAWFAAHLAELGDREAAIRLIEVDAPTVMSYGDAAVFDTECRRAMLQNLPKATPYFRSHEAGSTSAGGLAGEDLAEDFAAILSAPADGTQRLYTVLDALTTGMPVVSIKPLLRQIALDPARPEWVRWRAADAWLNGHARPAQGRRELFDALSAESVTLGREQVRFHLVRDALDPGLTTANLRSLIWGLRESGHSNEVGRAWWLKAELEKRPHPDLFDTPIEEWLRENSGSDYQYEVNDLLDKALASAVRNTYGLTADRLWQWIMNATWYRFPHLEEDSQKAVREWLDADIKREIDFFFVIADSLSDGDGPWMATSLFIEAAKRLPGEAVVRRLLSLADSNSSEPKRMLDHAVHCVTSVIADPDLYWQVYERLSRMPEMTVQFESMRVHKLEPWRLDDMKRGAERRKKKARQKAKDIERLRPLLSAIACANRPSVLEWGAQCYFKGRGNDSDAEPPGMTALVTAFDHEVADAIAGGWRYILTADFVWPSVAEIGRAHGGPGGDYFVEYAVLAGLDMCLERAEYSFLDEVQQRVAISVLRKIDSIRYKERNIRLKNWAIQKICQDVNAAAAMFLEFWVIAFEAGAKDIALLWVLQRFDLAVPVLKTALPQLLRSRAGMPAHALGQALAAGAKHISLPILCELASEALIDGTVRGKSRRLWGYVDFALNPSKFENPDLPVPSQRTILATIDLALRNHNLIDAFDIDDDARAIRLSMMISGLGRYVKPSADYSSARHMRSSNREEVVRNSINALGAMVGSGVSKLFSRLLADAALEGWRKELMHARSQHLRLMRDRTFVHPSPKQVLQALAGKAPVNAADLRAVVLEELRRLQRELRTGVDSPWREYWDNIGKRNSMPGPKLENTCRNHLIIRLSDRLQPYGIAATMAEARHAEETRSDVAVFSHAGKTFPIEIKRDSNAELWGAASTQLQHYANADTADGSGLYLVFWFNHADSCVPAPPNDSVRPVSANELEAMLIDRLPEDLRSRVDVVVFDVSDPDGQLKSKAKKRATRRKPKST
jgi:hypothetical protein